MFSYKQDFYWLGAIKGIALFSRALISLILHASYVSYIFAARQASGTQGIMSANLRTFANFKIQYLLNGLRFFNNFIFHISVCLNEFHDAAVVQ